MKVYALEEHMATRLVVEAWKRADPQLAEPTMKWALTSDLTPALLDLADGRIAALDDAGIDTAVLSLTTPGLQPFAAAKAAALQKPVNDAIADAVSRHPGPLQGFAVLATPAPAADELRRTVTQLGLNGALVNPHSGEQSLGAPDFGDVYEAAADFRAPIYLHPRAPLPAVSQAYHQGFSDPANGLLATGALGWHYDAGPTLLRMIVSGLFDRLPDLQIILGHWGEIVLFYLDRIAALDKVTGLERPISDYFRSNIFITPGGISSHRYLWWAIEGWGPNASCTRPTTSSTASTPDRHADSLRQHRSAKPNVSASSSVTGKNSWPASSADQYHSPPDHPRKAATR